MIQEQQTPNQKTLIKFKENISKQDKDRLDQLINEYTLFYLHQRSSGIKKVPLRFHVDQSIKPQDYVTFYSNVESWDVAKFFPPQPHYLWVQIPLLASIAHIKMENLHSLILKKLLINNIQPISYMDCPNLRTLTIESYQTFSLKPLIKTIFPHLQSLYIHKATKNSSQQYRSLTRLKTNKKMKRFQLTFKQSHELLDYAMYIYTKKCLQNLIEADLVDRLFL